MAPAGLVQPRCDLCVPNPRRNRLLLDYTAAGHVPRIDKGAQ